MIPSWAGYVAGLAAIGAVYAAGYSGGRDTEREKWQRQAAIEAQKVRERENALQAQVDAAGVALSEKQSQIDIATRAMSNRTKVYYRANPSDNVRCLTDDRLRAIADADQAAYAASATR